MGSRTCDVYFAFGPEPGSYLLSTRTEFRTSRMPPFLTERMTNVDRVHWAVVGVNGYAAFAYRGKDAEEGEWSWRSSAFSSGLPKPNARLAKIVSENRSLSISVTMGPGNTVVICDPVKGKVYAANLDKDVETLIKMRRNVWHVALGVDGAYVILHDQGVSWDLRGKYGNLDKLLSRMNEEGGPDVSYVTLNPWRADQYFLVHRDGTAHVQMDVPTEVELRPLLKRHDGPCPTAERAAKVLEASNPRKIQEHPPAPSANGQGFTWLRNPFGHGANALGM
ncbi:hypothetical protein VTJ83DRAFT_4627 [Remersonia thermophila]|uniref:Uncharacterized protein n=1 Tax=Remersonia thermophila TaxID=72144 RepID=A0ABR4DAI6_9PEZI